MNFTVQDSAERARALDHRQSYIVQAPAGSGKTELLTLRYMSLLARCEEPEEVLAITFTRKAASEMRARIIGSLQTAKSLRGEHSISLLTSDDDTNPIKDPLKRDNFRIANNVIEADIDKGWNLDRHPGRLRIQTIDSFNIYLANQLPISSRVGGDLNVTTDVAPLFQAAIRTTLSIIEEESDEGASVRTLFSHLDNDLSRIEPLLLSLMHKRDQWSDSLSVLLSNPLDARNTLKHFIDELAAETLESLSVHLAPHTGTLIELNNYAAENWLSKNGQGPLTLDRMPGVDSEDLKYWKQFTRLLLTGSGGWRARITATEGFPSPKSGPKDRIEHATRAIQEIKNLIIELGANPKGELIRKSLHALAELPSAESIDSQWPLLSALLKTLQRLNQELILEFTRRGVIDHTQAGGAAVAALADIDGPTELALALDNKLSHILIDEFQDTSERQIELLKRLISGWTPGDGRTLFVVGDAMQSCYNFRNANVGIYLNVRANGVEDHPVIPLDLKMNFRSQAPLVTLINKLFSKAFPAYEDISQGAVRYSKSAAGKEASGIEPLTATWISYRDSEHATDAKILEAQKIAEKVKQLRKADPTSSIAILARTRNQFKYIVKELRAANIQWIATDIDRLSTVTIISDLIALLKALMNLADKAAWLATLRAPWCGLDSADLFFLANTDPEASVWRNIQTLVESVAEDNRSDISEEGLMRIKAIHSKIMILLQARMHCSVRELMEYAWHLLGGDMLIANSVEERSVAYFFAQCDEHDNCYGIDDVDSFSETVQQSFIPGESNETFGDTSNDNGTVHLLTIHKSKGLQYDHVIIPQLNGRSRANEKDLVIMHQRLNREGIARLFIAALPELDGGNDSQPNPGELLYKFVKNEHKQKDFFEETRLIYIAMTRAKQSVSLYATLPENTDDEGNVKPLMPATNCLLARIWKPLTELEDFSPEQIEVNPQEKKINSETTGEYPILTPIRRLRKVSRLSEEQTAVIHEQFNREADLKNVEENTLDQERQLAKLLGTLSHSFLEAYSLETFDAKKTLEAIAPRWLRKLMRLGADKALATKRIEETQSELLRCITGCNSWIFESKNTEAEFELKLATSQRQSGEEFHKHRIVDRTLVVDGERWIIDFKTSRKNETQSEEEFIATQIEEYRTQLESYGSLFEGLEKKPQRLALLLTSIDKLVEL
ncbi:MAG: UvrD-helicase domain-containing protein [Pseudohongiellaceae bacterium]